MSSNSKVSIILPVYNAEPYLHSAIDSVLAQTHRNIELVISDNCSTDKTYAIAKQYADKDERVKLSKNDTNLGWALNLNKTIQDSTGDYIELFGHDDYFEPTCIEKLASILDQNPNVVVVTSARNWIDAKGDLIEVVRKFNESKLLAGAEAIRSTIGTMENWISAPAMFRSRLKGQGFNINVAMYADLNYWCGMFTQGDLYYLNEVLFSYRIHDGSGTSVMMKDWIFAVDLLRMVDSYCAYFQKQNETKAQMHERLGRKLVDWAEYVVCDREYSIEHLLQPSRIDLSRWPLIESERDAADANDFRRAACLALTEAARQRRKHHKEICEYDQNKQSLLVEAESNRGELDNLRAENARLSSELQSLKSSTSWRITAPLRRTMGLVRPNA